MMSISALLRNAVAVVRYSLNRITLPKWLIGRILLQLSGSKMVCAVGTRILRPFPFLRERIRQRIREGLGVATNPSPVYLALTQEAETAYLSRSPTSSHQTAMTEPQKGSMEVRPSRFDVIYTAPALMTLSERVILYSLVFGLRPQRCLEIGSNKGGSSLIISAALDDIGAGHLVCVDFDPQIATEHWQQLVHHTTLLKGTSPDILGQALDAAGGKFNFVLIDADHELPGVIRDIEGVLPLLEDEAYMIFHDAHYYQVSQGIDQMLVKYKNRLSDCGMLSVERTPEGRVENGQPVIWGGLRMLRQRRSAV
jgi:predicted O-methyltransferase YrrM